MPRLVTLAYRMGRQSKAKRARRERAASLPLSSREARRLGDKKERRGRRIQPLLASYEALAPRPGRVGQGLVSRNNQRWEHIYEHVAESSAATMPALSPLPWIDYGLAKIGASFRGHLADYTGDWPDHLRWGADGGASAARFLHLGQAVGAAVIARQQLERWTANLAFSQHIQREPQEPQADFIRRTWSVYELTVDLGITYEGLSELLHARGPLLPLVEWESAELLSPPPPAAAMEALGVVAGAVNASLLQVWGCVATVLQDLQGDASRRLIATFQEQAPFAMDTA
jgi:hypothetical protein